MTLRPREQKGSELLISELDDAFDGLDARISTHSHGAVTLNLTNITGAVTSNSGGLTFDFAAGLGLTTAALSNHSHAFATTSTTGAAVVVAASGSDGVTLAFPSFLTTAQPVGAYLTTAMASNASTLFAATGFTTTSAAGAVIAGTHDTAGLKLGVPAFLTTAQAPGAYLTTARASNDAIGLNTAITQNGVSMSANSSGLSLNFPAFLTTAMQSASSSNFAKTGFTTTSVAGAVVAGTMDTAGLKIAVPSFLTTAAQSSHSHAVSLNLTNILGTTAGNSNGITLNLSVNAGGAGDGGNVLAAGGSTAASTGTVQFDNGGGVSFGLNAGTITAAHNGLTTAAQSDHSHGNPTLALTNLTGTTASGSNGFTLSLSGNAAGGGAAVTLGGMELLPAANNTAFSTLGQNSLYLQKVVPLVNVSFNNIELRVSGSTVSSAIQANANHTIKYGLYSLDTGNNSYGSIATSSILLQASYSSNLSMGLTVSQGAASYTASSAGTAIGSQLSGFKHLYLPFTNTMLAGVGYAVGLLISSTTTGATGPHRLAVLNHSVINNVVIGKIYATTIRGSNSTFVGDYAQGVYNTTTGEMPASVALSQMTNAISQMRLYMQFEV